jgi:hypothetical protein
MEKQEKLETIVKLLSKSMFYEYWKWETPNQRVIEMLMREVGYWDYEDEDDMIQKTFVDEELYQKSVKKIPDTLIEV